MTDFWGAVEVLESA